MNAASPGRAKTDTPKINKKNTSTQNKEEKGSKPTQQEKQPEVKQSETDEQVKGSAAVTTTATVVDKNGKKKSRKDRRKQKKNTQIQKHNLRKTENNNIVANPGQRNRYQSQILQNLQNRILTCLMTLVSSWSLKSRCLPICQISIAAVEIFLMIYLTVTAITGMIRIFNEER